MLQRNVTTVEKLPQNCASVVDGMGLVQRVKGDQATFGDVATTVLSMTLNEGAESNRIDVVFDTYRENSIKYSEVKRVVISCKLSQERRSSGSGEVF